MARRNNHGVTWQTIHLEGALLLPDLLEQIAKNEATHQKEREYQIPAGLRMVEEIGRSYQIARALHDDFKKRQQLASSDAFSLTEGFITKFMSNCLGWNSLKKTQNKRVGEYSFPIQRIAYEYVPLSIGPFNTSVDTLDSRFAVRGGRKDRNRSLFQMGQEYLNATGKSSWGLISNGNVIRLLRSSPTLARPQYLEFDLHAILEDDHYAEYMLLWKILHVSRIYDTEYESVMTVWEEWRNETISTGERVRDGLRDGVTKALKELGSGFLAHRANIELRRKFEEGQLDKQELYHQLLHLVYRFLFLFALEERRTENGLRLIFDPDPSLVDERDLYERGYSLDRLRQVMLKRSSYNYYSDLWQTQQIVFESLARGEKRLALPALGGLFGKDVCVDLDTATVDNATFLKAMESLRWARTSSGQYSYVDYRNMGTEELGSVYESLLELVPVVDLQAKDFRFVGIDDDESTAGNVRKSTGSYYTPSFLVDQLIKTALVPVVERTIEENPENAEEAILNLSIIDPACGSGHFLLAAARKTAEYLAMVRNPDGTITPQEYRKAVKDVIHRCIYGVDLNPMALELTKIALWLEGYEPGKPLGFLDRHLVCGNSVLGIFDLEALDKGIPSDAYKQLSGDDEEVCKRLRLENRSGQKAFKEHEENPLQNDLFADQPIRDVFSTLEEMPEESVEDIEAKRTRYKELKRQIEENPKQVASDILLGAFLLPKQEDTHSPTSQTLYRYYVLNQPNQEDLRAIEGAQRACKEANVLHWPFAFPRIFSQGGFDVVLGNPPWDVSQFSEKEFFAFNNPMIASMEGEERKLAIDELEATNPEQFEQYVEAKRENESFNQFYQKSLRYSLQEKKINLYSLFTELCYFLKKTSGFTGIIVPTGIATDDSNKILFQELVEQKQLLSLIDFSNRKRIFPAIGSELKFSLITLSEATKSTFMFFLFEIEQITDERKRFEISQDDFHLLNPNTRTCPIFSSQADATITKKIYKKAPVLLDKTPGKQPETAWEIAFTQGLFNMTNHSKYFEKTSHINSYMLYEGKMIHQFDHRWRMWLNNNLELVLEEQKKDFYFLGLPRYWVNKTLVHQKIKSTLAAKFNLHNGKNCNPKNEHLKWLICWRDICRSTDERSVISSIIPIGAVGHTLSLIWFHKKYSAQDQVLLVANLNSIIIDYIARQKLGGMHLSFYHLEQFPIIEIYRYTDSIKNYIVSRVLELVYTAEAMRPWAEEIGYFGEPFVYDDEYRSILKAELDAIYGRIYQLTKEELHFILDPKSYYDAEYPSLTFPKLKNNEIKKYGEYRTMRLVLEAWDRQEQEPELWQ